MKQGRHTIQIRETILQSVCPISFNAWVQEAADAEAHLQMIKIDALVINPRAGGLMGKMKAAKPKTDTRDPCMRQGLCLHCRDGHFPGECPRAVGGSSLAKDLGRKEADTPLKKGTAKAGVQWALQFEVMEENSSSSSTKEEERAGKGWDLL
ncbi:UNVERIFIED_CONTAM: hypothetical protein K2H54_045864 [Gekko kuhli]